MLSFLKIWANTSHNKIGATEKSSAHIVVENTATSHTEIGNTALSLSLDTTDTAIHLDLTSASSTPVPQSTIRESLSFPGIDIDFSESNPLLLGSTYRAGSIDPSLEPLPANPIFRSIEGETIVYEPQMRVSYNYACFSLQQGLLTDWDLHILKVIATFGSVCMPTTALKTLLRLMGETENMGNNCRRLYSSMDRLCRHNLITYAHLQAPGKAPASLRIICLTGYGSRMVKSLGTPHRFRALDVLDAPTMKNRSQTTMMITQFLLHLRDHISDFSIRPVLVRKEIHPDAIVRPAAIIRLMSENFCIEVPRSGMSDYLSFYTDKLRRYALVFGEQQPRLIFCGEDEEFNRNLYRHLTLHSKEHGFALSNILFSHDLAQFGERFNTCLYTFAEDGSQITFKLPCQ